MEAAEPLSEKESENLTELVVATVKFFVRIQRSGG
jgi:hypothetical protein